jgi:hypothetical protein
MTMAMMMMMMIDDDDDDDWLVVWNHEFFADFPYIGNVLIPTDYRIFVRGVGIPPTR